MKREGKVSAKSEDKVGERYACRHRGAAANVTYMRLPVSAANGAVKRNNNLFLPVFSKARADWVCLAYK